MSEVDSHNFFGGLIISVITALLAENFVFARALGVSTMIMAAKNKRNLPGICLGVLYFTLTASWAATRQLEPDRRIPVGRAVSDAL